MLYPGEGGGGVCGQTERGDPPPPRSGSVKIKDVISSDYNLKNKQQDFVNSYITQTPIIDPSAISEELKNLEYPLYFLDFETFGPAVPTFEGLHPYEQYPFQYSCHILDSNNKLSHKEYLHANTQDPRRSIIHALINDLGKKGTIIAYNMGFEKGVISKLAESFPKYKNELEYINERFWDQLAIFKKYYTDYRFKGSNGLKSVLPIVVPGMSYDNLNVSNGSQAQVVWSNMISLSNKSKKKELTDQLLEYCRLDTFAMVEIHKELMKLK